jgi:TRAP-type C4-dicarboxylate transport system substrate-binding protein/tRNA A-37 threonylcarbamoyl transferase component Bud32
MRLGAVEGLIERLKAALGHRYTVEREVGRGGMAVVYLAQDRRHKRHVALKVLRPEVATSIGGERFLREIELAAQLIHPNILPLYDSGEADGLLYYVMPYVDGDSLRSRIQREGPLRIGDAVRILRDVADALDHAHGRGVVHRDIKPDNVLLAERHALVTDFGISKALSKAASPETLTTVGVSLGTPTYMSPEQATAEKDIDHRADIYALGVVAYEVLVGEPPITGESQQAVLTAQVLNQPYPITKRREEIPAPLGDLVMACLEKRREDRWQSAEDVLRRLEALTTPSGGVTPTTVRITSRKSLRRKRWAARIGLGAGALAAAGALALGGSWVATRPAAVLQPVTIRFAADFPPPPHPAGLALHAFAERLPDVIPGSEARVYYAGVLYTIPEAFEALREGTLEAAWGQFGKSAAVEPWANAIVAPGVLSSIGAINTLDQLDAVRAIHDRFEAVHGIKVLGTGHMSLHMGIAGKQRLMSSEHLLGKKIRSMGPADSAQLDAWGVSPMVMAFGDVPTALEGRVIEGLLTSIGGWSSIMEQAPYFTIVGVNTVVSDYYWIGVSRRWWDRLNEPTQAALDELLVEEIIPLQKRLNYCVDMLFIQRFGTDDPAKAGIYVMSPEETAELDEVRGEAVINWIKGNTPPAAHRWVDQFVEEARAAVVANPPGTSWIEQTDCQKLADEGLILIPG